MDIKKIINAYNDWLLNTNKSEFVKDLGIEKCGKDYINEKFKQMQYNSMFFWNRCDESRKNKIIDKIQRSIA